MRKGWEIKILSEACKVFADGDWIESKDQSSEGIRLIQTGNIGFGYYKDKVDKSRFVSEETFKKLICTEIKAGDLLVSRLPDPVGKSCIIPETNTKMITGVDCTIIRPKDFLLSEFLCYYQMSDKYLKDVQIGVSGATRQRISRKNLGQIKIPLPPLPEQQEIVSILDDTFESIECVKSNAEQNIKNAKELFESYLNGIFENLNLEEMTLGEVCNFIQGIQRDVKLQSENKKENQVRFLRIIDFTQGNEQPRYINNPGEKYILESNDISLVRYGASTGFVCRGLEGALANNLFRVIPKSNKMITNDFLFVYLTAPIFQKVIKESMNGAAMPAISFGLIKDIPFPKISIKEQQTIVLKLDAISAETKRLESLYQQKLNDLEELKKSILQKAFNGELKTSKISA